MKQLRAFAENFKGRAVEWLSHILGDKAELATAGLAGSTVSAAVDWRGVAAAMRRIVVGTLCAMFLSPLGLPLLRWLLSGAKIPVENAAGMSGFLMGVLGVVFIEYLLRVFRVKLNSVTGATGKDDSKD